ncbi:Cell division protein Cdc6 [Penicillium concentricum]|uniref:Cell division control protein n=1 Tax=Penicillium concentricum TaxID=293559 RepID=A0A9W9UVR2_9EURO|nr:Cell division protein Cdc6 [Penicillium concentricum]KAJ5356531.1 Cell division protein Cdc6 [Penicillium concentricum]
MAGTVLGKRSRAVEPALPVRTASKRRTIAPRVHQQDTVPTLRRTRSTVKKAVEPDQENGESKTVSENVSSKHTLRDDQFKSPVKINSHFTVSKPVDEEITKPIEFEFKTPSKSRFRDDLPQSPITPRHRVQVGAKPVTPRTPRHADLPPTPRQSATPNIVNSVYSQARQLFARGSNSGRLVGRDAEREKLVSFITEGVESRKGGCLYISGPPGTGKSAMVQEVCADLDLSNVRVSHVNCASMRISRDVYSRLVQDFCGDSDMFKKSEGDRLKSTFIPSKKGQDLFLVTLDEIDHLLNGDSGVLQSLFEWSLQSKSKLMLIGIANALDLTDRSLPQLKAKNLKPRLLPFLPYSAASIANVMTNRLRSLLPAGAESDPKLVPFVQPAAIQLCSKKVASQTGDLRKAFELIKRAIDVIEQETFQKLDKQAKEAENVSILGENTNLSSPAKVGSVPKPTSMSSYTVITAPRASIAHIARITSAAFGQGTVQRLQSLNLQQKAAICSLIALERKRRQLEVPSTPSKSRNSAPTIKQAFDTYCALCRNDNILHPLTATEFKDVLSNLETMGLVGEYQGRGRGGTVAGGTDLRRTPSKSGAPSTPHKALDEQGLVCFVSQQEIESQIVGPGEGILRRLLRGEGL